MPALSILGEFAEKIGLPGTLEKRLIIKRGTTIDYEGMNYIFQILKNR